MFDQRIFYTIIILLLLAVIVLFFIFLKNGRKAAPNHKAIFSIGLLWTIVGITLHNYLISILGLIFLIYGLANREKWTNAKAWGDFTKKEKYIKAFAIAVLVLTLFVFASTLFID